MNGDFRWENMMNGDFRWEKDMINGDTRWENDVVNGVPGKRMIWFQVRKYDEWWFQVREGYDKWWFQVREYVMNGDFRWENDMWWMVILGENGVINGDFRQENELCDEWFQVRIVWWMVMLEERMMWCLVILGEKNNLTTGDFRWEWCPQTAGTNQRSAGDPATLHLHRHEIPLRFSKPVSISVFWCVGSAHGANSIDTAAVFFTPVKAPFTADSFQEKY